MNTSAHNVWEVIAAADNVHQILPGIITSCSVEQAVEGATRTCGMADGAVLTETIHTIDPTARVFGYSIDAQAVFPIDGYRGTLQVVPLPAGGSLATWGATFHVTDDTMADEVRTQFHGMFELGLQGIEGLASRSA